MFVLPKGTLVKVGGLPFRLLDDVSTDGSLQNYILALRHTCTGLAAEEVQVPAGEPSIETLEKCVISAQQQIMHVMGAWQANQVKLHELADRVRALEGTLHTNLNASTSMRIEDKSV